MKKIIIIFISLAYFNGKSQELVIGKERVNSGIVFIFEGGIKDIVIPKSLNI